MALGLFAALVAAGPVMAQGAKMQAAATTRASTAEVAPKPSADMQALLNAFASLEPKPIETLEPAEARKQPTMADAVMKLAEERKIKMPSNDDIEHDSASYVNQHGDKLNMEIYYTKTGEDVKNKPVIVYFHGGGWVIANTKVYEASIMALARKTGAVVMAPQYRQAPEDRFPAAHEDAFAAYQWAMANAKTYNADANRIAVVGESAGGNLAANVGIMTRQAKMKQPVALGLIYPVAGTDMTTPSYMANANAKPLNKPMMQWFVNNIASPADRAKVTADPRLNLQVANLTGLPRTTVITAGIDPLRSEGAMLADKLKAAGVNTTYQNYAGASHEFFGADLVLPDAKSAQDLLAGQLNAAFGK
ncbi:MAG: alpha/beta hydrolase [Alphaproteobacteria bacterium]|nr:MAG: alpha/beta hydrolase [Alphaproteobacteria bacterium]